MSRSLLDLRPEFGRLVGEWLNRCNAKGVAVLIHCTRRTPEQQDALYQIGRRGVDGEKIVTNAKAGQSFHQYGAAIDAVPWEWYDDAAKPGLETRLDWSPFDSEGDLDARWSVMVASAEDVGLDWSGNWKGFREYVHFQERGVSLEGLRGHGDPEQA